MRIAKNIVFLMAFTSADHTSEMIISCIYTVSNQDQRKSSAFTNAEMLIWVFSEINC